ncbi:hypothetical protein D6861_010570 [Macrococcoides caseolyticum]|nr:hypothetical protein [Macrococcus caseolyticus]RKO13287.1 hypothetical protein D6861_10180 [Macrococcus caseolyticus]
MNKLLKNTSKLVIFSLLLYPTQYFENKANAEKVDRPLVEYNKIHNVEEVNGSHLSSNYKLANYNTTTDSETSELEEEIYSTVLEEEHADILNNIKSKFEDNGMIVVKASIENSHILVDAKTKTNGAIAHFDYDIANGDFDIKSLVDNKVQTFDADVVSDTDNNTIANLTNTKTKDSMVIKEDSVHNNVVFAIPIIVASGAEIVLSVAAAYFIVVEGHKMVAAVKAIPALLKSKKRNYNHFRAALKNDKLYIGKGLSLTSAVKRGKDRKNVWSISAKYAKAVASKVNTKGPAFKEIDKDRKGKYYHYHPYKRTPKMHSFYGTAQ